ALIHSKMSKEEIEKNLKDIENHRVHVVINVAMLGEGYDHPYLSIAAIFRPFRHPLPYAQFIGRILRIIPPEEATEFDNVGQVVSHEFLYLDKLWEYYKNQIQESEIIAHLTKYEEDIDDANEDNDDNKRQYDTSIGKVHELGKGKVIHDTYLETELIRKRNEALREQRKKIEELRKILGISEEKAKQIIYQATSEDSELKRPDIYFKRKSKDIDERIKQEIVPELIVQFKLQWDGDDLKNCPLFKNTKYEWIAKKGKNNAAFLSIYFNYALTQIIGAKKSEWVQSDLEIAERKLEEIREFVEGILSEYTGIELL
ncbi:MAG: repair protein RadD, partial [Thermosediminibacterales bacterium]|nr:repair protein RadD [Thermosediminibacterales bacterium]